MYRSHNCGELRESHVFKQVVQEQSINSKLKLFGRSITKSKKQ